MSRWYVEKDGTGIEKSGTGVEKSGTGIEKSGTGIEKSGTGIEKSGTGFSKTLLVGLILASAICSSANANPIRPEGALQIVTDDNTIALSWIIDGSVFSGVSTLHGTFARLELTEVALANSWIESIDTTGGGTGSSTDTTGGGTGSKTDTTGGGTGNSTDTTGGGTGDGIETTGGGTGSSTDTTGGGTGSSTSTTGGGTGAEFVNVPSEHIILTTGGGTGSDSISITLPAGTGLQMEIALDCDTANVSILDANYAEVVTFENVPVIGSTGLCAQNPYGKFGGNRAQGAGNDGID